MQAEERNFSSDKWRYTFAVNTAKKSNSFGSASFRYLFATLWVVLRKGADVLQPRYFLAPASPLYTAEIDDDSPVFVAIVAVVIDNRGFIIIDVTD